MSCMTLFAQETAMATTQLTRIACHEFCTPLRVEEKTEHKVLRMSWVVVTDEHGNRRLHSAWNVAEQGLAQPACSVTTNRQNYPKRYEERNPHESHRNRD